jgi:hypothetical protein
MASVYPWKNLENNACALFDEMAHFQIGLPEQVGQNIPADRATKLILKSIEIGELQNIKFTKHGLPKIITLKECLNTKIRVFNENSQKNSEDLRVASKLAGLEPGEQVGTSIPKPRSSRNKIVPDKITSLRVT